MVVVADTSSPMLTDRQRIAMLERRVASLVAERTELWQHLRMMREAVDNNARAMVKMIENFELLSGVVFRDALPGEDPLRPVPRARKPRLN